MPDRYQPFRNTTGLGTYYTIWDTKDQKYLHCVDGSRWVGDKRQAEQIAAEGNRIELKNVQQPSTGGG